MAAGAVRGKAHFEDLVDGLTEAVEIVVYEACQEKGKRGVSWEDIRKLQRGVIVEALETEMQWIRSALF